MVYFLLVSLKIIHSWVWRSAKWNRPTLLLNADCRLTFNTTVLDRLDRNSHYCCRHYIQIYNVYSTYIKWKWFKLSSTFHGLWWIWIMSPALLQIPRHYTNIDTWCCVFCEIQRELANWATQSLCPLFQSTRHLGTTVSRTNQPRTHRQEFLLKLILFSVRLAARYCSIYVFQNLESLKYHMRCPNRLVKSEYFIRVETEIFKGNIEP